MDAVAENLVLQSKNFEDSVAQRRKRSIGLLSSILGSSSAAKNGGPSAPADNGVRFVQKYKMCFYLKKLSFVILFRVVALVRSLVHC